MSSATAFCSSAATSLFADASYEAAAPAAVAPAAAGGSFDGGGVGRRLQGEPRGGEGDDIDKGGRSLVAASKVQLLLREAVLSGGDGLATDAKRAQEGA